MMEDDRLVQLALTRGFVTREQVERARSEQRTLADRGIDHGLHFLLQELGFITDEQARQLRKCASSSAIRALEIEGFIIQGRLGSGGMGDVFRARHADGREAAVKLLSSKLARNEEYVRRFLREARATTRLRHPHIVATYGAGESLGTRYLMMELVEGPSLKTWLVENGRFDPDRAIVLLRQMAAALKDAWDHGVLHRDVKPANILIGPARPGVDEPFCSKLCDFGLARVENQAGDPEMSHGGLTGTGLALGTPHYMSPEQASGEHDVDQRSDIYGLGATLFHALLGQTLFSGKSSAVIMYKQVTESVDLEQLRQIRVPEALVVLVGRMLAKRRHERIASWTEVEAELARLAPPPAPAPAPAVAPTAGAPPATRPERRPATTALAPTPEVPSGPLPTRRRPVALILVTAAMMALFAAVAAGLVLRSLGDQEAVTPATFAAALAGSASGQGHRRDLLLAPGIYGPIRLGASHRGLRLRAAGQGVVVRGSATAAALNCEPGLSDAVLSGLALQVAEGRAAVEAIGGCELRLIDCSLAGDLVVAGGVIAGERLSIAGRVLLSDRGSVGLAGSRIDGAVVDRADLRLSGVVVGGSLAVRDGSLGLAGVRVSAATAPALSLLRSHATLSDVLLEAPGIGLEARAAELAEVTRLTVRGSGPSIAWEGDRQAVWRWSGFALATPPRGLPGSIPTGSGADPARLPNGP